MAGSETLVEALKTTADSQNISFVDASQSAGYTKDHNDISSVFLEKGSYSAFVELHIEQGPILEEEGKPFSHLLLTLNIVHCAHYHSEFLIIYFLYRNTNWHSNCHCSPGKHKSGVPGKWRPCWCCPNAK